MDHKKDSVLLEPVQTQAMSFRPIGRCMYPTLRIGDRFVTIPPRKKYRIGDIVALRSGNEYLVHRIVAKFNGRFFLKGDKGGFAGHFCSSQDLLGVAVFRERNGRIKSIDSFLSRITGVFISLSFMLTGILRLRLGLLGWRKPS